MRSGDQMRANQNKIEYNWCRWWLFIFCRKMWTKERRTML